MWFKKAHIGSHFGRFALLLFIASIFTAQVSPIRALAVTGVPGAPTAVVATGLEGSASVTWAAPSSAGSGPITSYILTAVPGGATNTVPGTSLTGTLGGLANGTAYTITVAAVNGSGTGPTASSNSITPSHPGGQYHALSPYRICDTRASDPSNLSGSDAQCLGKTLSQGGILAVQVSGTNPTGYSSGGVPSTGISAVVLNVTVTNTTSAGYLTVWPSDQARPTASNLNWQVGDTVANLVQVAVSSTGQVSLYNFLGTTDVVIDVEGYVATDPSNTYGLYHALSPYRICDTRASDPSKLSGSDAQCLGKTLSQGGTLAVQVSGTNPTGYSSGGVPSTGISAVVLNVTVTDTTTSGFLTVWPAGLTRPTASNLNWSPGQTIPNRVIVALGTSGGINLYNLIGSSDVVVDVAGYFSSGGSTPGSYFSGFSPTRICDTRTGNPSGLSGTQAQCNGLTIAAGGSLTIQVAGVGGIPSENSPTPPVAVVLNVTATNTTAASYLSAYPSGESPPVASDLNWVPGQTTPNFVEVALGASGEVSFYNFQGSTDVVVDVAGYESGSDVVPPSTQVLSTQSLSLLSTVSSDLSTLTFSGTDSQLLSLIPGDVIVAGSAVPLPHGLLRMITAISTVGTDLIVTTASTQITQALPQGEVIPTSITPVAPAGVGVPNSPFLWSFASSNLSGSGSAISNTIDPNFTGNFNCSSSALASLNASIALSLKTSFSLDWSWLHVSNADFTMSIADSVSAQADLQAAASCLLNSTPLLSVHATFSDIVFFVGPVPVDISPSVQFYVSGSGDASGSISVSVSQTALATAGIQYDSSTGFTPVQTLQNNYTPSLTISGGADASVQLEAQLSFLIYDVAGPSLDVIAGLGLTANVNANPWWTLTGSLGAGVGFSVPILGLNYSDPSLISTSSVLAQASGGAPPQPPTVSSLSPTSGIHGTSVTITGTNFTSGSTVSFGGVAATATVNSPTQITATVPSGSGSVNVTVTTSVGTSATGAASLFTYLLPSVTGLSPTGGPPGTSVIITGTNFTSGSTVSFGGVAATATVNSPTQITATAPSGSGTVNVTVTTGAGTSATGTASQFIYSPPPTVTNLSPTSGIHGTSVTITGTNFTSGSTVSFGGVAATATVNSPTQITATAPSGSGTVYVTVTTGSGTSATGTASQFTYLPPTVTSLSPNSGSTLTSVIITGTNFTSGSTVSFGGVAATATVNSSTQITTSAPSGSGTVYVTVTTSAGTSATGTASQFTYPPPPTVTGLSPATGPTGTCVFVSGTNFITGSVVYFGGVPANTTINSSTLITAFAPTGSGTVYVTVTSSSGTSPTGPASQYTY